MAYATCMHGGTGAGVVIIIFQRSFMQCTERVQSSHLWQARTRENRKLILSGVATAMKRFSNAELKETNPHFDQVHNVLAHPLRNTQCPMHNAQQSTATASTALNFN